MKTKFRSLPIVNNGLIFFFSCYMLVEIVGDIFPWQGGRWSWRHITAMVVCMIFLCSVVGSARLNMQIMRLHHARFTPPTKTLPQIVFLLLSGCVLYLTFNFDSLIALSYDDHLSSYHMEITLPEWPWFINMPIFRNDASIHVSNLQILFFLLVPYAMALSVALHNSGLTAATPVIRYAALSQDLIGWHITFAVVLILFSLLLLFGAYTQTEWLRNELSNDPKLFNSSNVVHLLILFLVASLLLLYGQWLLRDGLRLRANHVRLRVGHDGRRN